MSIFLISKSWKTGSSLFHPQVIYVYLLLQNTNLLTSQHFSDLAYFVRKKKKILPFLLPKFTAKIDFKIRLQLSLCTIYTDSPVAAEGVSVHPDAQEMVTFTLTSVRLCLNSHTPERTSMWEEQLLLCVSEVNEYQFQALVLAVTIN